MRLPQIPKLYSRLRSHCVVIWRRKSVLVLVCAFTLVYLIRGHLVCTNTQPLQHVENVCINYKSGHAVGNLCEELCQPQGIQALSCHNFYQEKETVFSGRWKNYSVVFKSAKKMIESELLYWSKTAKKIVYPNNEEFLNLIKTLIKHKFNIVINDIDVKRLSFTRYGPEISRRQTEMKNVWSLVNDNEYLAINLYEKFEIFPKLIGTCGTLYAVQKLNPIPNYWHVVTLYDSKEEWLKRVKISVLILDFLVHLEKGLPEPLMICNIKLNHFGVTDDFKKIMYLDVDSVYPVSVVSKITGDGAECTRHSDCDFLNCRSFCNLISMRCQHGVVNNNLQIVCERIFLGWVLSGRVMVAGLLAGAHAPRELRELLERCANPAAERGMPRAPTSEDIRKSLHSFLLHLTY